MKLNKKLLYIKLLLGFYWVMLIFCVVIWPFFKGGLPFELRVFLDKKENSYSITDYVFMIIDFVAFSISIISTIAILFNRIWFRWGILLGVCLHTLSLFFFGPVIEPSALAAVSKIGTMSMTIAIVFLFFDVSYVSSTKL